MIKRHLLKMTFFSSLSGRSFTTVIIVSGTGTRCLCHLSPRSGSTGLLCRTGPAPNGADRANVRPSADRSTTRIGSTASHYHLSKRCQNGLERTSEWAHKPSHVYAESELGHFCSRANWFVSMKFNRKIQ